MKYATLDKNGLPTGFYSDDIHENIPTDAIEITDEQWIECINNSGARQFVNGTLGSYVAPITLEQSIAIQESTTDTYIQNKIDVYNLANGVKFKNIDSFAKYAINTSSEYNADAIKFIAYAANIWKRVREYQKNSTTILTDAEFQAVLDGVSF
jgi:hypothetical protein